MLNLWLIIGPLFLLIAVISIAKIGVWMWFMSRLFGWEPPKRSRESANGGIKHWLTIVATVLGIISTTIGLVEKCDPVRIPTSRTERVSYGNVCCTGIGNCPLMMGSLQIGSVCTCVGIFGLVEGKVCQ